MSTRYSPAHKLLVLRLLSAFSGNVFQTSRFTGVPERTLRDWIISARQAGGLPRTRLRLQFVQKRR
jgi:hypothetical protein